MEFLAVVAVPDQEDPTRLILYDSAGTDPQSGGACGWRGIEG